MYLLWQFLVASEEIMPMKAVSSLGLDLYANLTVNHVVSVNLISIHYGEMNVFWNVLCMFFYKIKKKNHQHTCVYIDSSLYLEASFIYTH